MGTPSCTGWNKENFRMRWIASLCGRILCVALLGVALPLALLGQGTTTASVSGQVTDPSGAAIPGATVTITNTGTNATRVATTGANGSYAVPNLIAATYKVTVTKSGFQAAVIPSLVATIGAQILQNVQLRVGSQSAEVQVTGAAPLLQTQAATMSQQVESSSISELPITNRNITSIAALTMGAILPASLGQGGQYGSRQLDVIINGGRTSSTNYVLDGIDIRDLRFNNMSLVPITDSVNEVQVLSNSYSTEYGQGSAVVVSETKSGTNQLHGDAFEFVQNTVLNARNFFNSAPAAKLPYQANDFGFTLGGPVIKNKVFLFGGYEGVRTATSGPGGGIVPDPAALGLNGAAANLSAYSTPILDPDPASPTFGQPFPGNIIPNSRISPMANALSPTYPAPNNACGTTFPNDNYCGSGRHTEIDNNITLRGDVTFSNSNSGFVRYVRYHSAQNSLPLFQTSYSQPSVNPLESNNIAMGETWAISPSLVNTLNLGFNRVTVLPNTPSPQGKNWDSALGLIGLAGGSIPEFYGMPSAGISGIGAAKISNPASPAVGSSFNNAGGIGGSPQGGLDNIYSIADKLTKVIGNQTIEIGVQYQDRRFLQQTNNNSEGSFSFNGSFSGNAIADYLLGFCSNCSAGVGNTVGWYSDHTFAPFFNDVWQVTPGLTATFGVRYGYQGVFVRQDGRQGAFDPVSQQIAFHTVPSNIPAPFLPYVNLTPNFFPAGIIKPDYNDFEPRVGLSYRMNNNTVIHAGSMVSHENTDLNELQFTTNVAPLYENYNVNNIVPTGSTIADYNSNPAVKAAVDGAKIYPGGFSSSSQYFPNPANVTVFPGGFPAPFSVSPVNRTPYTIQWNLNVQRMLPDNLMLQVGYEGSVTHKLWKRWNQNQRVAGVTPYPQFGTGMLTSSNMANANFNALAVSLQRRMTNGLSLLANFQYSRAIDNNSGEADANDTALRTNFNLDRGPSDFNQPFRTSISAVYQPKLHNIALRDWQATSIIVINSGLPYTPSTNNICQCGSYIPNRANPVAGVSSAVSNPTIQEWFNPKAYTDPPASGDQGIVGRNSLIGPGLVNVDFGLDRSFQIGEGRSLQLRSEFANLFNHPNFGNPNSNIDSTSVGTITSARAAREVKLGLRIVF